MGQMEEMQAFVKIVEAGGVTSAANRMGLAPSAISRKLKDLEKRLGTQLIQRTTRQMTLTDAGRTYLDHAERILSEIEEANSDIAQLGSRLAGKIHLAAPLSFGLRHLPDVLSSFLQDNPEIELDVDMSDRIVDLSAEGFNVALRIGQLEDSSLIAKKIVDIPSIAAASPDFVAKRPAIQSPRDLEKEEIMLYTGTRKRMTHFKVKSPSGSTQHISLKHSFQSNSGDLLAQMAIRNHGYTIAPAFILDEHIRSGKLTPLLHDHDWGKVTLYAVWAPTKHLTARTRALIDHCVKYISKIDFSCS